MARTQGQVPPQALRAPGLTFPMAGVGGSDGMVLCGAGHSGVYIAGGLLCWQEQHKGGPRWDRALSLSPFYIMAVGEVWGIV